jgi:hypothetical protein
MALYCWPLMVVGPFTDMPYGKIESVNSRSEMFWGLAESRAMTVKMLPLDAWLILRILWLSSSATYRFPLVSTATPLGELKLAPVPVPSALP